MIPLPRFPAIDGLGWSVTVEPEFSTKISKHVSGRTVAKSNYQYPIYHIELTYEVLYAGSASQFGGLAPHSLQKLTSFFKRMQGGAGVFALKLSDLTRDPADSTVKGQLIGAGNGFKTTFTFMRSTDIYLEPVDIIERLGLNVYTAGDGLKTYGTDYKIWQNSTNQLMPYNQIVFITAPNGAFNRGGIKIPNDITYDGTWYHMCRFSDDTSTYENFMYQLWRNKAVKLTTVKP